MNLTPIEKAEWTKFANDFTKEVERVAIRDIYAGFKLATVTFDWSPKRRSSRGGYYSDGPGINIAMNHLCKENHGEIYRIFEYKSFDSDPDIGGFYTKRKHDRLKMVIVHEVAHALQYYCYKINNFRCKPHGPTWKNLYKRLRWEFINPYFENQPAMKQDYEAYIKKLISYTKKDSFFERAASK